MATCREQEVRWWARVRGNGAAGDGAAGRRGSAPWTRRPVHRQGEGRGARGEGRTHGATPGRRAWARGGGKETAAAAGRHSGGGIGSGGDGGGGGGEGDGGLGGGGHGGGGCVGSCRSSCRTCREGLEPLGPRLHHGHEPATTSCVDGVPTRVCVLRSSEPQCICERGRHSVGGRMSAAGASEWPSARHGRRRTVRCALSVDEVRARAPRITSPHRQLRHSSWRGRRRARIARRRSTPGCRWAPWAWWSR